MFKQSGLHSNEYTSQLKYCCNFIASIKSLEPNSKTVLT